MTSTHEAELALLQQHAEVLFDMDGERLVATNEIDGDPPPRLFHARGRDTQKIWFRGDVSADAIAACLAAAASLPPWDGRVPAASTYDALRRALALDSPVASEEMGLAFEFGERVPIRATGEIVVIDDANAHLLEPNFPYTRAMLHWRRPVVGAVVDGAVVSACFSARTRATASEAGVATEEPYRGRGLASLVVAAWREAVEAEGRQPLYSTTWGNDASRAVARRLGLIAYAATASLS